MWHALAGVHYAANGGALLRHAMRDMAAVLAAWIVNRALQNR